MRQKLICIEHGFKKGLGGISKIEKCMHCQLEKGEIKKEDFMPFPKLFDGKFHGEDEIEFNFFEVHDSHKSVMLERKEFVLAPRHNEPALRYTKDDDNVGLYRPEYFLFHGYGFRVLVSSQGENKRCDENGIPIKEEMDEFIMGFFGLKYASDS